MNSPIETDPNFRWRSERPRGVTAVSFAPRAVLARDRLRDRAQPAVAVPAEHEALVGDGHAVVAITEMPDEHGAGRRNPWIAGALCGRKLNDRFWRSPLRDDRRQGLEVVRENLLAAQVLCYRLGHRSACGSLGSARFVVNGSGKAPFPEGSGRREK